MRYAAGDLIDQRYRVVRELGEGGMAEVYQAIDSSTGDSVVLKIPHVALAGDLAAFNRYRREIEIGARLDHPGIQRLLSDPKLPYMVLEYVDGQTLRAYIHEHAPLSVDKSLQLTARLARTLEYVHNQGVVHRDLKPENILITPQGELKLADFGIALRLGSRRLTFSHLSNAVGTPDYMAPEQVRGERGDVRTDVYALGVLLHELLTGKVPYPSDDGALEAMRRKAETEPVLVRRLRSDVPPTVEAIVYRALRRLPEERYQSMAELRRDLVAPDTVAIPSYRPDIPPPRQLGDLPPWRTTVRVMAAIFGAMILLGVAAELLHRAVAR
jgi:eukaryotic-like serine/threonine-protein kinase